MAASSEWMCAAHDGLAYPRVGGLAKRALDILVAASGLVLLAPVLAALAWAIRMDSAGPILYTQVRSGTRQRPFRILKFRTMVVDADRRLQDVLHLNIHAQHGTDARLYKIKDDPRVTRLGRFLRRYALDELPQLANVLAGEMSLVGPRPLTLVEDSFVSGADRLRARVRPGITGPWQVSGGNQLPFHEMMRLDRAYVENWSFLGDLGLLARTLPAVLRQSDGA